MDRNPETISVRQYFQNQLKLMKKQGVLVWRFSNFENQQNFEQYLELVLKDLNGFLGWDQEITDENQVAPLSINSGELSVFLYAIIYRLFGRS